jgi:hypothetical protein
MYSRYFDPVTGKPARYFDPVTGKPANNKHL